MNDQRIIRAVIVPADSEQPARIEDISPTLGVLQHLVGGWLEAIAGDGWTAFINEEGKLNMLPVNEAGNRILAVLNWESVGRDVVVGPLLIVGPADENGFETSVSDDVLGKILDWYRANGTVKKAGDQ